MTGLFQELTHLPGVRRGDEDFLVMFELGSPGGPGGPGGGGSEWDV